MLSILNIIEDTMVDGPGFRTSIYAAGCPNACPGCHNPMSWDINNGTWMLTEDIMGIIENDPFANVTFSGGDPMFQAEGFTELALAIRRRTAKTIWCYTGFTFETLCKSNQHLQLLRLIDVLVDGPFMERLRNPDLLFRGSSNQRLIDVPRSLEQHETVLYQPDIAVPA